MLTCRIFGNAELTYNDVEKECNAFNVANGLIGSSNGPLSRLTFQNEFNEDCDLNKQRQGLQYSNNRACYGGIAVDNKSIIAHSPSTPHIKNIYNDFKYNTDILAKNINIIPETKYIINL